MGKSAKESVKRHNEQFSDKLFCKIKWVLGAIGM